MPLLESAICLSFLSLRSPSPSSWARERVATMAMNARQYPSFIISIINRYTRRVINHKYTRVAINQIDNSIRK